MTQSPEPLRPRLASLVASNVVFLLSVTQYINEAKTLWAALSAVMLVVILVQLRARAAAALEQEQASRRRLQQALDQACEEPFAPGEEAAFRYGKIRRQLGLDGQ